MDGSVAGQQTAFVPPKITPAERPLSNFGLLRTMIRDPVAAVSQVAYEEPFVRISAGGRDLFTLTAPELVETVLARRQEDFAKSRIDARLFEPFFGTSLLTAEGQEWRWQRRLAAPAFRQSNLSAYLPAMRGPFKDLASRWRRAPGLQRIDQATTVAALDVICRAFFSNFAASDAERVADIIGRYLAPVAWVIAYGTLNLPSCTPHPGKLKMWRAARAGRRLVGTFVARRRTERLDPPDLAQALIDAQDSETGRSLSDDDLLGLFLTLLAAGHETSANGLTWALYCLAAQPERQEALAAKVREIVGTRPVKPEHLDALTDVRHFLEETMRLFPPVPMLARRCLRDCQVGSELIRAGSLVFIPIYAIHRHRSLWEAPDAFNPERFRASAVQARPRCAYMPFGAGPRICIGASFAMLEMVVGLTTMLSQVRLELADPTPPQPIHRITLRPERELVLRVVASD